MVRSIVDAFQTSAIASILSNEKYKGDALLQKTYTVDFLSKTIKKNEGEMQQYYIENSHPAIINPETFDLVQNELRKRRPNRRQSRVYAFAIAFTQIRQLFIRLLVVLSLNKTKNPLK